MPTVGKPSSYSQAAAKMLPVMAMVQVAQKQEVKIKRIRYDVTYLPHPREVFFVSKISSLCPCMSSGVHPFIPVPLLLPPGWASHGEQTQSQEAQALSALLQFSYLEIIK